MKNCFSLVTMAIDFQYDILHISSQSSLCFQLNKATPIYVSRRWSGC